MNEDEFQLGNLVAMARRRAKLVGAVAGLVLLTVIFVAAILPNRYVASTTLLVEPQSVSKRLVEGGQQEEDLMGRLHLLTMQILSRARLSRIIEELDLYPELSEEVTREEVIEFMRSQIWVEPVLPVLGTGRGRRDDVSINTFRLFFRHERAGIAATVTNRLASDFIDEHIRERVRSSGDTAEFIEAELARLASRAREVTEQIAQVKDANVGSLPEDMRSAQDRLSRTYEALRFAQQRLGEAESNATFYQQQAKVARLVEGGRGDVIGRAVTPALRLSELEIQLGALRARGLTEKHPDIVIAEAEAAEIRATLEGKEGEAAPPASLAEQEALAQAERARQQASAARAEIDRMAEEIRGIEARIAAIPRVSEQLTALERELFSLNESYQSYSNKRLEANVAANMERRQKGEQFRVLEPAFVPPEASSPNRRLIIVMGGLFGLFLGGGLALLLELTDSSYHTPRSLQESLRIPVLAAIPAILLDADRRTRRRRQFREAVATATVTVTLLLVSAAGYVYVNMPGLWRGETETVGPVPATPAASPAAPTTLPEQPSAPAPSVLAPPTDG